jgi:hypothetical protein
MPEQGYKKIEHIILPPHAKRILSDAFSVCDESGVAEYNDNVAVRRELRDHLRRHDKGDLQFKNSEELRGAALKLLSRAKGFVADSSLRSRFVTLQGVLEKYGVFAIDQERSLEITRDLTAQSRKWYRRTFYRNVLQSRLFERTVIESIDEKVDLITARAADVFADFFVENLKLIDRMRRSYYSMGMLKRHKRLENAMHTIFGVQQVNASLNQIHDELFLEDDNRTAKAVIDHGGSSPGAMVSFIHRLHGLFLMSIHGQWNLTSLGSVKERVLRMERFGEARTALSTLTYISEVGVFSDDPIANHAKHELWQCALDMTRELVNSEKIRLPASMDLDEIQDKIRRRKETIMAYLVQYGGTPRPEVRGSTAPGRISGKIIPFRKSPIVPFRPVRLNNGGPGKIGKP